MIAVVAYNGIRQICLIAFFLLCFASIRFSRWRILLKQVNRPASDVIVVTWYYGFSSHVGRLNYWLVKVPTWNHSLCNLLTWPAVKNMCLAVTCSKQCAAETTHFGATIVPPQKCFAPSRKRIDAIQGQVPGSAGSPPIILVSRSFSTRPFIISIQDTTLDDLTKMKTSTFPVWKLETQKSSYVTRSILSFRASISRPRLSCQYMSTRIESGGISDSGDWVMAPLSIELITQKSALCIGRRRWGLLTFCWRMFSMFSRSIDFLQVNTVHPISFDLGAELPTYLRIRCIAPYALRSVVPTKVQVPTAVMISQLGKFVFMGHLV